MKSIYLNFYKFILATFVMYNFTFCKKFVLDDIDYSKRLFISDMHLSANGLLIYTNLDKNDDLNK